MEEFLLEKIASMLKEWKRDINKINNESQKLYALSNWAEWHIYFGNNGKDEPLFKQDYRTDLEADKLLEECGIGRLTKEPGPGDEK